MPNTRLYDRKNVSVRSSSQGLVAVEFSSKLGVHGWSVGAGGAQDVSSMLAQFPSVVELGRPLCVTSNATDPSAQVEISVPTGKYWRLIGGMGYYIADDAAVTRTPEITIEDSGSNVLETITISTKTANQEEVDHFLFGTGDNVSGNLAKPAVGKLTIAEALTAGDTFTIGDRTYTFVAGTDQSTVAYGINMGADEAATKVFIEAEFVDGDHPLVNAIAFSGDIMKFTARSNGLDTNSIVFIEGTLTHSNNVLDGGGVLGALTPDAADPADGLGALDYPTAGVLMVPTDKVVINVGLGEADDNYEVAIFGIEFDNDPR